MLSIKGVLCRDHSARVRHSLLGSRRRPTRISSSSVYIQRARNRTDLCWRRYDDWKGKELSSAAGMKILELRGQNPYLVVEHYPCRILVVYIRYRWCPTTNRSGGRGTFVRRCAGLVDAARQCRRGTPRRRDGFSKTNFAPFGKKTGVIMSPFDLFSEIQRNDFEKASTSGPHGGETVSTTGSTEHQFVSSTGYSSSRTPSRAFGPRQRHGHGGSAWPGHR